MKKCFSQTWQEDSDLTLVLFLDLVSSVSSIRIGSDDLNYFLTQVTKLIEPVADDM